VVKSKAAGDSVTLHNKELNEKDSKQLCAIQLSCGNAATLSSAHQWRQGKGTKTPKLQNELQGLRVSVWYGFRIAF
jgi:hypothetical protein